MSVFLECLTPEMKTRILGTMVATVQQTWHTKERKSEMQEKERRMKGSSMAKYYPSVLSSICQRVTRQGISTSKFCSLYDLFFEEVQLLNEEPKSTRI